MKVSPLRFWILFFLLTLCSSQSRYSAVYYCIPGLVPCTGRASSNQTPWWYMHPHLLSGLMVGMFVFRLGYNNVRLCFHVLLLTYPKELFLEALLSSSYDLERKVPVKCLHLSGATNQYRSALLTLRHRCQDPKWMPEAADFTEPCIYYDFSCTYLPMTNCNLSIRHSKRLAIISDNKIKQL